MPIKYRQVQAFDLLDVQTPQTLEQKKNHEKTLDKELDSDEIIIDNVTPKSLSKCSTNSLEKALEVSHKLKVLSKGEQNESDIVSMASSVEDFAVCLLDPIKSRNDLNIFQQGVDIVVDKAISCHRKKFLSHPVVLSLLEKEWKGAFHGISWWQQLLLYAMVMLDVFIFPMVFVPLLLCRLVLKKGGNQGQAPENKCKSLYDKYILTPYMIFLRDIFSYMILVILHFVVCLQETVLEFNVVEWIIMVFFLGRIAMEINQIVEEKTIWVYVSNPWNLLDILMISIYVVLFFVRVITWGLQTSTYESRLIAVGGYLYGINAMFLTLRVCGQILEYNRSIGTIQIALIKITGAIMVIACQLLAALLAFSFAITKVYLAEMTYSGVNNATSHGLCTMSDNSLSCWWLNFEYLAWSLLGSGGPDAMASKDGTSDVIAKILYMLFLLNAVLLIMNMLIAVLTNTYQKVEDHAFHEWSYRKARTIRTYGQYHPVPVPFNIISLICLLFNCCCCKSGCDILRAVKKEDKLSDEFLRLLRRLESYYFAEYGYSFPLTDGNKLDLVLKETEGNRHLSGHIAENVFRQDVKRLNDQHWDFAQDFCVDGQQLFISSPSPQNQSQLLRLGARYCHPLSKERPGFEVLIKESGQKRYIAIGVADKQYDLNSFPGWTGNSAAFHVDDGKIFDTSEDDNKRIGKETGKMAHRGDVIGCVLMYDKVAQGKLPVCFTLNGTTVGEGHLNANQNFHPFIGIGDPEIKLIFRMPTTDQMQVLSNEVLSLTETMSQLMVQVTELSRLAKQGSFQTPINGRNTKPTSQAGTSPVFLDIRKDASTTGQLSSLKRNLLKTTMMPIFDQRPQMDGFITITKEICNEKDCWLARRDDKVIVPPMGVNHEQTMSSNLSRFLRFESALKQTTSPTDQRLLQGVDFTVKKVESMKSYGKHAAAKHSRTNEGLLKGIEITVDADEQQQQQQQLMSHLVDSDENLVNKSGDAFVFKVTNNNTEDVYISVLLYQLNGAVRILYPKDGFSGKLSNGCPVQDIHPVYLPKGCLRIMTQPDLSLGEPQMGSETLVLYASSKEFDLRALAQTPIKTDPDLTSMVYNKEQEVCDYQEFLRALAQFNDTATVDFQWMIEKRKLAVVKNETLP